MIMETCLARELVLFWGFPLVPKVRFGYFVVFRFNDLYSLRRFVRIFLLRRASFFVEIYLVYLE
jgi:hypothetical protein